MLVWRAPPMLTVTSFCWTIHSGTQRCCIFEIAAIKFMIKQHSYFYSSFYPLLVRWMRWWANISSSKFLIVLFFQLTFSSLHHRPSTYPLLYALYLLLTLLVLSAFYRELVLGFLKDRTRVLVTHNMALCVSSADLVICINSLPSPNNSNNHSSPQNSPQNGHGRGDRKSVV